MYNFDIAIQAATGIVVSSVAWCTLVRTGLVNKFVEKMVKKRVEKDEVKTRVNTASEFEMVPNGHTDDEEYDEDANDVTTLKNSKHSKQATNEVYETSGITGSQPSPSESSKSSSKSRLQRWKEKATYGLNVDICDESNLDPNEVALRERSEKFDPRTEQAFAWLQVCTGKLCGTTVQSSVLLIFNFVFSLRSLFGQLCSWKQRYCQWFVFTVSPGYSSYCISLFLQL